MIIDYSQIYEKLKFFNIKLLIPWLTQCKKLKKKIKKWELEPFWNFIFWEPDPASIENMIPTQHWFGDLLEEAPRTPGWQRWGEEGFQVSSFNHGRIWGTHRLANLVYPSLTIPGTLHTLHLTYKGPGISPSGACTLVLTTQARVHQWEHKLEWASQWEPVWLVTLLPHWLWPRLAA